MCSLTIECVLLLYTYANLTGQILAALPKHIQVQVCIRPVPVHTLNVQIAAEVPVYTHTHTHTHTHTDVQEKGRENTLYNKRTHSIVREHIL